MFAEKMTERNVVTGSRMVPVSIVRVGDENVTERECENEDYLSILRVRETTNGP